MYLNLSMLCIFKTNHCGQPYIWIWRANYVTLAHASVTPNFPPSLIPGDQRPREISCQLDFSHPATLSPSLVSCVLTAFHSMLLSFWAPFSEWGSAKILG